MKKLFFLGSFILVLALFIVGAPLLFNVNKYRPRLVELVNQSMDGKLEMGELSLSLWGGFKIQVDGLKVLDAQGNEVIRVKHAFFDLPFLPLLKGEPILTFHMNQPEVCIVKNAQGQLNLLSLLKKPPARPSSLTRGSQVVSVPPAAAASRSFPAFIIRARLGVECVSAHLNYSDLLTGFKGSIHDLNIKFQDLSLVHPTKFEMLAHLNTKMGKIFHFKSPLKWVGTLAPQVIEGRVDQVSLNTSFSFLNAEIILQGSLLGLSGVQSPVISFQLKSNEVGLKPWMDVLPQLVAYDLSGSLGVEAQVKGSFEKPDYRVKFLMHGMGLKLPSLKSKSQIDGSLSIAPERIESFLLRVKAPSNDIELRGSMVSFSKPQIQVQIHSTGMDLDAWMESPAIAENQTGGFSQTGALGKKTSPSVEEDSDALLAPIRANSFLAGMGVSMKLSLAAVKVKGIQISDLACHMDFKNLSFFLKECGLTVFSGRLKAESRIYLSPKIPEYQFNAELSRLNLQEAVASKMDFLKNTMTGQAFFSIKAQGASFTAKRALSNLKADGKMRIEDATLTSIDVGKMASEALSKSIDKLGEKIPALKGKSLGAAPYKKFRYTSISSDFSIQNGKFLAPHFLAQAMPNEGIDLKGSTTFGIQDGSIDSSWEVTDTYNLTHARDLSVEQAGVKVEHLLAEGNNPVRFPVHVGCTVVAPCYSYAQVPAFLGKIALKNVSSSLGTHAKQQFKKQAEGLIKKAPAALQDKLKNLFGR